MQLQYHGGFCCGVYHIWGFGYYPTDPLPAQLAKQMGVRGAGCTHHPATEARPQETAVERLDYLLSVAKKNRSKGIIEVVLASYQWATWHDELIKRGFVMAMEALNSSSTRNIRVYLLDTGKDIKEAKPVAKEKPLR